MYGILVFCKSLTSLAIGQQRQVTGLLHDTAQQAYRLRKELAVFASTSHRPKKACGPVHQDHRPAWRLVGCNVFPDSGVQCIPFDHLVEKLMGQGIQQKGLLQATEAFLPAIDAIFADPIEASRCVDPHPFRKRRQHVHHNGDRGFQIRERRVSGFRKRAVTRRAIVDGACSPCFRVYVRPIATSLPPQSPQRRWIMVMLLPSDKIWCFRKEHDSLQP